MANPALTATLSGSAGTQSIAVVTADFGAGAGDSYTWFQDTPNTAGTYHVGEGGLAQWYHGAQSLTASMAPGADTSNKYSGMFGWVDGSNGTGDYQRPCSGAGSSFGFRVLGASSDATTWANTAQVTVHLKGATGATDFETFHTAWANGRHALAKKNTSGGDYSGSGTGEAFPAPSLATAAFSSSGTAATTPARVFFNGTHCGVVVAAYDTTPGSMNTSGSGTAGAVAYTNYYPNTGAFIPAGAVASVLLVLSGYDNQITATVRDAIAADYRTHGSAGTTPGTNGLLITTGSVPTWTDRWGSAPVNASSAYDEQIGAYRIQAAASNHVTVGGTAAQWGVDGTTVKARFSPCFVIGGWTDSAATPTVTYNGVALTSGTDFVAYNDTANQVLHLCLLFDIGSGGVRSSTNASPASVGALAVSAGASGPAVTAASATFTAAASLAGAGTSSPAAGPAITAASGTLSGGVSLSGTGTGRPAIRAATAAVLLAGATLGIGAGTQTSGTLLGGLGFFPGVSSSGGALIQPAVTPATGTLDGGATLSGTGTASPVTPGSTPATGTLRVSVSLSGSGIALPAIRAAAAALSSGAWLSGPGSATAAIVAATGALATSAALSGGATRQPAVIVASGTLGVGATLSAVGSIGGIIPATGTLGVGATLSGAATIGPAIRAAGPRTLEAGAALSGAGAATPPTAPIAAATGTLSASGTLAGAGAPQPAIRVAATRALEASATLSGNGNVLGQAPVTAGSATLVSSVSPTGQMGTTAPATLSFVGLPQLTAALTWRTLTAPIVIGGSEMIDVEGGPIDPLDQGVQIVASVSDIPAGTTIAAAIDPSGPTKQSGFDPATAASSFVTTAPSVVQAAGATTATVTLAVGDGTQQDDTHYEVPLALTAGQTKLVYRLRVAVSDD